MKHYWTIAALVLSASAAACAGTKAAPAVNATTVTSAPAPARPSAEPAAPRSTPAAEGTESAAGESAPAAATSEPRAEPPEEVRATPCDGGWVCVNVSPKDRKIQKRETLLVGDPAVPSTWSKTTDGRSAIAFDTFSRGEVKFALRRKLGNKNEVVAKVGKGREIVIDRHDGGIDDFTHIGIIAAEGKDGALLVDIKYMR